MHPSIQRLIDAQKKPVALKLQETQKTPEIKGSYENRVSLPYSDETILHVAEGILEKRIYNAPTFDINDKHDIIRYLKMSLGTLEHEVLLVIFCNSALKVVHHERVAIGTYDSCEAHPYQIAKMALQHNAPMIILAHNHPSGVSEPSAQDSRFTSTLQNGLQFLEMKLLDHIIVGADGAHYSFAENGDL